MSTNLHLEAKREVYIKKDNKFVFAGEQTEKVELFQTPTKITYQILDSENILEAYKEWVLSFCKDEQIPVYDASPTELYDIECHNAFCKDEEKRPMPPIKGYETYNYGAERVEELKYWIELREKEGYTIRWYAM